MKSDDKGVAYEVSRSNVEQAVRNILDEVDPHPERDGLKETPSRFFRAIWEMTSGYSVLVSSLFKTFDERSDEMVVVKDIEFVSLCEHHLLPFVGMAYVGYLPDKRVIGLSKIPRVVDAFSRRLQVQERLTTEIADAMMEHLKPKGVGVVMEAHHSCMSCRGVRKASASMMTSSMRGAFRDDASTRAEFLNLINTGR